MKGFSDGCVTVQQTIAGRRIADDTTLLSKELCEDCLEKFGIWCYQDQRFAKGLAIEVEEKGTEVTMCDRKIRINQENRIEITRYEKNREYLILNEAEPKRIRFQPSLGHVSTRRVKSWITARWFDEIQKNDVPENIWFGQLEVVSEVICLGYPPKFVMQALGAISKPEWRQTLKLAKAWCKLLGTRNAAEMARQGLRQMLQDWMIDMKHM